jgi:hypothetical protein
VSLRQNGAGTGFTSAGAILPKGHDLLELKARFETWRTNRKYARQPIPDELWNAAANLSQRYPPSLVGRVLKLDSSRLKKFLLKRSPRTPVRKKPQAAFFQLPTDRDCIAGSRIIITAELNRLPDPNRTA